MRDIVRAIILQLGVVLMFFIVLHLYYYTSTTPEANFTYKIY